MNWEPLQTATGPGGVTTGITQFLFRNTDIFDANTPVLLSSILVKTISGFPSESRSPMFTCLLMNVVASESDWNARLPVVLSLFKIVSAFLVMEATTISALPSPSRSPISMPQGRSSAEKFFGGAKLIDVVELVFSIMPTLEDRSWVTAMSGLASPSRSPTLTFTTVVGRGCVIIGPRLMVPGILLFWTIKRLLVAVRN